MRKMNASGTLEEMRTLRNRGYVCCDFGIMMYSVKQRQWLRQSIVR